MIEFRPFTKNDWMGYQGAESFEDKSPPRYAVMDVSVAVQDQPAAYLEAEVVHDALGIGVHIVIESSMDVVMFYVGAEPGDRCDAILALLQPRMTQAMLLALGFERQDC